MKRNIIETGMGAVVIIVAVLFLVFSYEISDTGPTKGYDLTAKFNAIDGLVAGSDVRIAGVKVGTVIDEWIDQKTYQAVVKLTVANRIQVPEDTVVRISSAGLLGGKYLKLEPGGSKVMMKNEGVLKNTRDVISLEELLGKVIFLVTGDQGSGKQ